MSNQERPSDLAIGAAGVGPGDTIAGKYLIDSVLGVGGMGVVFKARHLQLNGQVALKFLSMQYLSNSVAVGRFRREAQAAAQLRSEHVVRVFDVGTHSNGLPYLVMEYLEGYDLGGLIHDSGRLASDLTAELVIQTCSALEHAHREGIIHRDLKPSNLFCVPRPDGTLTIKVVDFGISKVTGASAALDEGITVTGHIVGSPSYMSPEQMKSPNRIDHRSDIWSLGVVLYECLTGNLPFPASTYAEICLKVHQEPPLAPRAYGVELPAGLEAVINTCLAKNPDGRYATAGELAAALLAFAPQARQDSVRAVTLSGAPGRTSTSAPRTRLGWAGAARKLGRLTLTEAGWARSAGSGSRRRLSRFLMASALVGLVGFGWLVFRHRSVDVDGDLSAGRASAAAPELAQPRPLPSTHASVDSNDSPLPVLVAAPTGSSASVLLAPRLAPSAAHPSGPSAPTPLPKATEAPANEKKRPATATSVRPATERDSKSSVWTR